MPDAILRIGTAIDTAPLQAGMQRSAGLVEASIGQIKAAFAEGMAASANAIKALESEMALLQGKIVTLEASLASAGKGHQAHASQAHESTHAIHALGDVIGLRMPRMVRGYLSSLEGVAPIMSMAFAPLMVIELIRSLEGLPEVIEKGINKLRGWDAEAKRTWETDIALAYKLRDAIDSANISLAAKQGTVGKSGMAKITADIQANAQALVMARDRLKEYKKEHEGAEATKKTLTPHIADTLSGVAGATQYAMALGMSKEREQAEVRIKETEGEVSRLLMEQVRLEAQRAELKGPDTAGEAIRQAREVSTARLEADKSTALALLTARQSYVRAEHQLQNISLDTEVATLKGAANEKVQVETRAANARVEEVRREGGNVLAARIKADAEIRAAELAHQTELHQIDTAATAERDKNLVESVRAHITALNDELRFTTEVHNHVYDLNEKLKKDKEALDEAMASADIARAGRVLIFEKAAVDASYEQHRITIQKKIELEKDLEKQRFDTEIAAAKARLSTEVKKGNEQVGGNALGIEAAQAKLDELKDQFEIVMQGLDIAAQKATINLAKVTMKVVQDVSGAFQSGFSQWEAGHKRFTVAMAEGFRHMADSMIQSLLRISTQVLLNLAIEEITGKKTQLINAKKAASGAWASASDLPSPLNVIVGAAEAAVAFAGAMSFDLGGVVPRTGMNLVHGGERVLTERQNTSFERLVGGDGGGGGGDQYHFHQAPGSSPHDVTSGTATFKRMLRDGRMPTT
ncbi:MAG TPA: hypothetical protein VNY05_37595 [Candidatus Acidoferrales bacterium]|jgi:hypothetical protein|nr:hypothetical protein [Candidatus Acidoferrales bacterium]